jgi:hypothetical protein
MVNDARTPFNEKIRSILGIGFFNAIVKSVIALGSKNLCSVELLTISAQHHNGVRCFCTDDSDSN